MSTALIVVDVQNDFCEGGSLAVEGGAAVAAGVSRHLQEHGGLYTAVAATADWHIDPGDHWSDEPDFQNSWPVHCEVGTIGVEFHAALAPALEHVQAVFRKGEHAAAYSGFEGAAEIHGRRLGLAQWLGQRGITSVEVVGLATDYCVRATALDAVRAGLGTTVLTDLVAGVAAGSIESTLAELREAGVRLRPATAPVTDRRDG